MKARFVFFAALLSPGIAAADCDLKVIRWLLDRGMPPAEAMARCEGKPARDKVAERSRAPVAEAPQPAPAPAPAPLPAPPTPETKSGQVVTVPGQSPAPSTTSTEPVATGTETKAQNADPGENDEAVVNPLATFSTTSSSGAHLVTAHIATMYAPIFRGTAAERRKRLFDHAVGVDISASLPAKSATVHDYAKQAVLRLDGGVLNLLAGYAGRRNAQSSSPYSDLPTGQENPRVNSFDRWYFLSGAYAEQMVPYVKQGIGVRSIKKKLEGTEYAGIGTAYLGLGVDGPLLSRTAGRAKDPNAGWTSLEAFVAMNAMNRHSFSEIFGVDASTGRFTSAGAKFTLGLPGKFFLSAQYGKGFGSNGRHIGDTAMVTFGYNNGAAQAEKKSEK